MTMKNYHLFLFTNPECPPCVRLKDHLTTLTADERAELDLVPLKNSEGDRTPLAEDLAVLSTPTLVATHVSTFCDVDAVTDEEYCDQDVTSVERFVGANAIISNLQSTLDAYTYAHSD